jgi:hypothetical protein
MTDLEVDEYWGPTTSVLEPPPYLPECSLWLLLVLIAENVIKRLSYRRYWEQSYITTVKTFREWFWTITLLPDLIHFLQWKTAMQNQCKCNSTERLVEKALLYHKSGESENDLLFCLYLLLWAAGSITSVISLSVGFLYFTAGCTAPGVQYLYFTPFHSLVGGGQWEEGVTAGSSPVCRRLFFSLDVTWGGVEEGGVTAAAADVGTVAVTGLCSTLSSGASVFTHADSAFLVCV